MPTEFYSICLDSSNCSLSDGGVDIDRIVGRFKTELPKIARSASVVAIEPARITVTIMTGHSVPISALLSLPGVRSAEPLKMTPRFH